MKKFTVYFFLILIGGWITGCKSNKGAGQLIGVQDRPKWKAMAPPYGMVYVHAGHLFVGQSDEDINLSNYQKPKSVTIAGFYMDETEITNNEYRQFTHWVRDSIAHVALDHMWDRTGNGDMVIDWDNYPIDWTAGSPDSEDLEFMYYDESNRVNGRREIDTRKLVYRWDWIDLKKAAKMKRDDAANRRSELIERDSVAIYPDTLVWIRDYEYAYNEPMTEGYFAHPAYDDYPVVGVTWKQAKAFSKWRTELMRNNTGGKPVKRNKKGRIKGKNLYSEVPDFKLPTEYEFEYAARGGRVSSTYPWGLNYLRNSKGCLLANFKPGRGDYAEDGGFYTTKVGFYNPNDFGLYDMSGNVSEWTESAFIENAHSFIHDMNPSVTYNAQKDDPETWKRKVVRGGSWKDIGYYLQTGVRDYEFQDTTKSYVGFRTVMAFRGRSLSDKP